MISHFGIEEDLVDVWMKKVGMASFMKIAQMTMKHQNIVFKHKNLD